MSKPCLSSLAALHTLRGILAMKPPGRTRSVGTKITEEEFVRLQACAATNRLSLSEWCREVLLVASTQGSPADQAILAEVIALRTIVANLIYAFTSEGKVTRDQMQAFMERADQTKLKRAIEFLSEAWRARKAAIVDGQGTKGAR